MNIVVKLDHFIFLFQLQNKFDSSLLQATGRVVGDDSSKTDYQSKLKKVIQLSGFSDPVYVEAYVHINQYDIVLDVLVVNQTGDTLQGLSLELATLGDCYIVCVCVCVCVCMFVSVCVCVCVC